MKSRIFRMVVAGPRAGFACLLTFRIDPFGLTDGGNPLRCSLFHGLNRTLENLDTCIDVHAYPVASVLFESLYLRSMTS